MIETRFDDILNQRGLSLYWLAKQTGIAYTTLWKLKTAESQGISFAVLDAICAALEVEPGAVLARKVKPKSKARSQRG